MAAVWLSILLTVACFSTLDAAIIKEEEQHGHHEAEHLLKNLMEQVLRELLQPEKDGKGKDGPGTWDNMPDNDEDQDQDDDKSGPSKKMMLQGKDGPNSWDNMPDFDEDDEDLDNDKGGHSKKMVLQHILRGDVERQPISFWNKTSLCDYHECFSKLKFVKVFNSDREAVKNHAMEATSAIDKVFRAFNFRVLLAGVDIIEDYWHGEEEEPDYYYLKPKVREYIWDKLRPANEFDSAVYISGPPYYRVYGGSGAGMGWVCEEPWVISGSSSIVSGRPADMLGILPHEMGHWIRGHAWGWDEHSRTYTKARYGEKYGLDKNYCRNPDNGNGVWCYIKSSFDDSYWDYCPVPKCGAPDVLSPEVQDLAKEAGECYKGDGSSYRGETALTWSGYPCRDWTSSGSNYKPTSYPDSDLTKNYCRNPSGGDDYAPWCYTAKPDYRKWEYCAIPKCIKDNEA
uniref:Kringle domain-containing protein n=1 Tax=Branchiostoma floridae TaxID=7739 RepID=C3ZR04_BRAFL|eukprot:XP_002589034.1 hypothetical protein BRAFLDRAFT_87507 [Branchiostoma floridae]